MDVFVYGTLTDPDRTAAVLGSDGFSSLGPARLHGLHRVDGRYPTLAPGGCVDGRLLRTERIEALDRYEGVASGLYVRVTVPVGGVRNEERAAVYVGDPARLGSPDVEWPGDGPFEERVERYVRGNVTVERLVDSWFGRIMGLQSSVASIRACRLAARSTNSSGSSSISPAWTPQRWA